MLIFGELEFLKSLVLSLSS